MSMIAYAIARLRNSGIPLAILERAFIPRQQGWRQTTKVNLDKLIESKVIRARVLPDMNMVGGVQDTILIGDLPIETYNGVYLTVRIPKDRTQGKSIVSVLEVLLLSPNFLGNFPYMSGNAYRPSYNTADASAMMGALKTMVTALDHIPSVSTCTAELIDDNVVMIQDINTLPYNAHLRCNLEYDEDFSNINPRSFPFMADLIEEATKAYVYNQLVINIGSAELRGGFDLGIFKSVVDEYKDSEKNYRDLIKLKATKIAMMNDRKRFERHIRALVGGGLK